MHCISYISDIQINISFFTYGWQRVWTPALSKPCLTLDLDSDQILVDFLHHF